MEAGKSLLLSPPHIHPPKNHLRTPLSSSVTVVHEQATPAVTYMRTTSIARYFPASVLCQEQRDDSRPHLQIMEEKAFQATLDQRHMENAVSFSEEKENSQCSQYLKEFKSQLLYWPGLWYLFPSLSTDEKPLLLSSPESAADGTAEDVGSRPGTVRKGSSNPMKPGDVLALAKKALAASKEAAALAENSFSFSTAALDEAPFPGTRSGELDAQVATEEVIVRSRRLLERRSKNRKMPNCPKAVVRETSSLRTADKDRGVKFDPNDPLRLFLMGPETKQLLTAKEESDLSIRIQELKRLEEVKQRLQLQFGCEPTLVEWAEAVGMNCRILQSCLHSGNRSREKMIYANFRLVVHVAKQYQGRGLSLQDLLQEGSMGLMKSLEKFKPQVGCRFSTYAYWWIRQAIRKAIVLNSRTIRLPENVYTLITQIRNMRKLYIQEGHQPTNEELAKRVGITVEKLEMLLVSARNPISIQQAAWQDEGVTFQEIIADPAVEIPEISVNKQLMRQHILNLLSVLKPRERQIIRHRYGIHDGERKSLSDIGALYGLSKERVRQVESRALDKLRQHISSQGLEAYEGLLI